HLLSCRRLHATLSRRPQWGPTSAPVRPATTPIRRTRLFVRRAGRAFASPVPTVARLSSCPRPSARPAGDHAAFHRRQGLVPYHLGLPRRRRALARRLTRVESVRSAS